MPLTEAEELELLELEAKAAGGKPTLGEALKRAVEATRKGYVDLTSKAEQVLMPSVGAPAQTQMGRVGQAVMGGLEALGTPVRLAGALRTDPRTGAKYKVSDPESNIFRPEMEKSKEAIRGELPPKSALEEELRAAGESTVELIGGIAGDPTALIAPFKKQAAAAAKAVVGMPNKALGKLASELSGVSEDALRAYGVGLGKQAKAIRGAAGSQSFIGKKLLGALDDWHKFLPEREAIEGALKNMESVNGQRIIDVLEGAKTGGKLKQTRGANEQIAELVQDVQNVMDDSGRISAKELYELRSEFDDVIDDAFGKESGRFVTAAKKARHEMREMLLESAEFSRNPEYVKAMQTLARKMDLAEDLKGYIGKSQRAQEKKVESFISNLFGKNSTEKQRIVKGIGDLFGDEFLEQSKLARMAYELGPEGKPAYMPRILTGRSLLGAGAGYALGGPEWAAPAIALSSPRAASATLSLADALEQSMRAAGRAATVKPGIYGAGAGGTRVVDPERERRRKEEMERMSAPFRR